MAQLEHLAKLTRIVAGPLEESEESYRIGDLAREFDVTLRTLRFYEDRNLIHPTRIGSTRLYSSSDRARLQFIMLAKQVGFSLVEIQELMSIYDDYQNLDDPISMVIDKFSRQMDVLSEQKSDLDTAMTKLRDSLAKLKAIQRDARN